MFLLEVGEGSDDAEGFGFSFQDGVNSAAGDDEDVEFGESLEGCLEVEVGTEGGSLGRDGVLTFRGENDLKGFGCWRDMRVSAGLFDAARKEDILPICKGTVGGIGHTEITHRSH